MNSLSSCLVARRFSTFLHHGQAINLVAIHARSSLVSPRSTAMTPLPLADRYVHFRDAVFSGVAEAPSGFAEPMTELELQSLWFSGAFGSEFTTTDGKTVRIADFGVWNSGAGPDFNNCAIMIDGQTLRGDIELDPDAPDWERHAHGANENFDRVVLHLFLHAPEERFYTRNSKHHAVPQVLLHAGMLPEGVKPKRHLAPARLGRCSTPLREMEAAQVQSIIESAAQHRLELKSKRLHRNVAAQGREQAIYQALSSTN